MTDRAQRVRWRLVVNGVLVELESRDGGRSGYVTINHAGGELYGGEINGCIWLFVGYRMREFESAMAEAIRQHPLGYEDPEYQAEADRRRATPIRCHIRRSPRARSCGKRQPAPSLVDEWNDWKWRWR